FLSQFWSGFLRETRWNAFPAHQPENQSLKRFSWARNGITVELISSFSIRCSSFASVVALSTGASFSFLGHKRDILASFFSLKHPHSLMWGLQGELEVKPPLQLMHSAVQGSWCGIGFPMPG
ncbi:Peroxidase skpo-1, partial [Frankliniella fusca]